MRLVRTVPRTHFLPATAEEIEIHLKTKIWGDYENGKTRPMYVPFVDGERRPEGLSCYGCKVVECRRGIAVFETGFVDLETEHSDNWLRAFPTWACKRNVEIFVDERYLVILDDASETRFEFFIYDRERRKGYSVQGSSSEHPEEYAFYARWPNRVRSWFSVAPSDRPPGEYRDFIAYVAAWTKDGNGKESLEAVYMVENAIDGMWASNIAKIEDRFRYVESKTDDDIVLRRISDDRSFRVPVCLAAGERVETDDDGRVVVDDETSTRYYDVDAETAERIDIFRVPVDVKRDVLRKAAFVRDYAFDFT